MDIWDLAQAVSNSVKNVSTFNQRYIINGGVFWLEEIINVFN